MKYLTTAVARDPSDAQNAYPVLPISISPLLVPIRTILNAETVPRAVQKVSSHQRAPNSLTLNASLIKSSFSIG